MRAAHVLANGKEMILNQEKGILSSHLLIGIFQKETMEGLGIELTINSDLTMEYGELKFEMTKRGQTIFKIGS